jgi:hypothetical protein
LKALLKAVPVPDGILTRLARDDAIIIVGYSAVAVPALAARWDIRLRIEHLDWATHYVPEPSCRIEVFVHEEKGYTRAHTAKDVQLVSS